MKHIWFAAKRYGYGWYPITKEGWLVVIAFVLLIEFPPLSILLLHIDIPDAQFVMLFLPYAAVLIALLIWVCVKKGEKARWRWGKLYHCSMATAQSTVDFLTDQMAGAGDVRSRKMFGEYAIYCDEKVVVLVCDDQLFVKPTEAGKAFIGAVTEAPPYPGSKNYYWIDESQWEDRDWLTHLIEITAHELPVPKAKPPSPRLRRPGQPKKAKGL